MTHRESLKSASMLVLVFTFGLLVNGLQSQPMPGQKPAGTGPTKLVANKIFVGDCNARDINKGMWILDSLGDTLEHVSSSSGFASWASDDVRFVCIDPRKNLKVLDISNPGQSIVIKLPTEEWPSTPSWCPTSDVIAFVMNDSNSTRQIHVVDVSENGQGFKALTTGKNHCVAPTWTPDGARIVYNEARADENKIVLISMRSNGTDRQVLYENDSLMMVNPVYSPDGKYIIAEGKGTGNLWRLNADGTDPINLTKIGQPMAPFGNPKFGNDSMWVYFVGKRGPDTQIEIFRSPVLGGVVQQISPREDHLEFMYVAPNK